MKKRSRLSIIAGLVTMIRPLIGRMLLAVIMGCLGNLAAIFIPIFACYGLLSVLGASGSFSIGVAFTLMILLALFRGPLRYAEQACNHDIAFRLLASIRNQVFASLRRLAPAKLDGSEKGNLIAIITSDIELLEVFFAHTISPVIIAAITSVLMSIFIGMIHPYLGTIAAVSYILVGVIIPCINEKKGRKLGKEYRDQFGKLNSSVLDNLYGMEEIIQFEQAKLRKKSMAEQTVQMEAFNAQLKATESRQKIATDTLILIAGAAATIASGVLMSRGSIDFNGALLAVIAVLSSFGPTAALSALSNNLTQTLASGERVLAILAESPATKDILDGKEYCDGVLTCDSISFSYASKDEKRTVLDGFKASFQENKIYGIYGKSGCGKSTLLKLMMRFYETESGEIRYGKYPVNTVKTSKLRKHVSYVTQETFLFQDTIENNIKIGRPEASKEEVILAAKKAAVHDFILSLPKGYGTKLGELGNTVSGGEKQRLGIARAFLQQGPVILFDEPTSNIDSLNEGIILKSIKEETENKTILLVSHRRSALGIADQLVEIKQSAS